MLQQLALPLVITSIVTIIALLGSDIHADLRYDRDAILDGEIWRLISGHLTHLGWSHLAMNVAGLLLIWALFTSSLSTMHWLAVLMTGALGTSGGLLLFNPELDWYVGLSGVLHSLFVVGCLCELNHQRRWDTGLLLAGVLLKLVWEQFSGPLPGSEASAGGTVIVDAHLYGAIWGFIYWLVVFVFWGRISQPTA